jgi:RimJ/RimL family protein N-acetyltransferase
VLQINFLVSSKDKIGVCRYGKSGTQMIVEPVTLEGTHIRLESLTSEHIPALCEVGLDAELWRWTIAQVNTPEAMREYVEEALREQDAGKALPFATIERSTGRVVGSTRFGTIEPAHRRVEIGWTWLGTEWQCTTINTEAKLLMLRHAFETLGCIRVELKTDKLNERSRKAILRLGAMEEGTLRHHLITQAGRLRDTVYFSILASEWKAIEARLEEMLRDRAAKGL